jgi:hypothetical protein
MDEFMIWFFSLKMDAVVGPWLKENAMTISFVLGALKEKDDAQG